MKVLYFMNHADQGGAALALYDLLVEIRDNPEIVPVVITGKNNRLNQMLSELGVENYSAPFKNFMSSSRKPEGVLKILLGIRYIVGQFIAIRKIENIVDFSTIDIIHSNLNRIDIGAILAQKYNIPHIWHIREHADGTDFKLVSIKRKPIEYMNSFESRYVYISKSVKNVWEKKGLKTYGRCIIYDGVRTELYQSRHTKKNDRLRMIFLGGYAKKKGQEDLIEALKDLPQEIKNQLKIDFYGNGAEEYIRFLKKRVAQYGLAEVMTLFSYQQDIWKKVPEYDVGLTCSKAEGFGRVTVEYMMSGLCAIASDGGATPEIIQDGVTGILYETSNKEALRDAIIWASNNQKAVQKIGENAAKSARQKFSMKKHAEEVKKLYYEVLKDARTNVLNHNSSI